MREQRLGSNFLILLVIIHMPVISDVTKPSSDSCGLQFMQYLGVSEPDKQSHVGDIDSMCVSTSRGLRS